MAVIGVTRLTPERLHALHRSRASIGALPPSPPTLRGRVGAVLISVVRRSLFWLLPQIDRFHGATVESIEDQQRALEELNGAFGRAVKEFALRQRDVQDRLRRLEAAADESRRRAVPPPEVLKALVPLAAPPAVDVGCLRGEWLDILGRAGIAAAGIEPDGRMAEQCQARGLDVTHCDPLTGLRHLPAQHFGTISMFDLPMSRPLPDLASLLSESLRVLKPGALVLLGVPRGDGTRTADILQAAIAGAGFCDVSLLAQGRVVSARRPS